MNSLKNLFIIAVLAAVGYGVYISLSRNNVDYRRSSDHNDEWPTASTVDMPSNSTAPARGGPLPIGEGVAKSSDSTAPTTNLASSADKLPVTAPSAPPLSDAPTASSAANPTATLGTPIPTDSVAATPSSRFAPSAQSTPDSSVRNLTPPPATSSQDASLEESSAESLIQAEFTAFMQNIRKTLDEGHLAKAHLTLSKFYDNPDIPPSMAKQITTLLDQLAGTVIYSRQHYLAPAYVTRPGNTIDGIARQYNVPWQLLARINGLMPQGATNADTSVKDQPLQAGRELKVVQGPFNAVIHLDRCELTLMVQGYYAGRFPIGVGRDQPNLEGEYTICNKTLSPAYRGPDGATIDPNDPRNPLGSAWIGLTERIGIHGTNDPQAIGRADGRGAISTSDRDLQDLYGILSLGSRVTILR